MSQQREVSLERLPLQDGEGHNLWDMTWHRAYGVSSGLTPNLLAPSGVYPKSLSSERGSESGQQQDQVLHPSSQVPDAGLQGQNPSSPVASPSDRASVPAQSLSELPQPDPPATAQAAVPPLEGYAAAQLSSQPSPAQPSAREQEPELRVEDLPVLQQGKDTPPQEASELRNKPAEDLADKRFAATTTSQEGGQCHTQRLVKKSYRSLS